MKFYIAEENIGPDTTREQVETVIKILKEKGWDVEYGLGKNKPMDIAEFGREDKIFEEFADEFMRCVEQMEGKSGQARTI